MLLTFPNSSAILTALIDGPDLFVTFRKGGVYKFLGGAAVAKDLEETQVSGGTGKFVNKNLKGKFESICVG